eukprot:16144-Heterococcus_DN1.PRE.2
MHVRKRHQSSCDTKYNCICINGTQEALLHLVKETHRRTQYQYLKKAHAISGRLDPFCLGMEIYGHYVRLFINSAAPQMLST